MGNAPPKASIATRSNRSFYWGPTPLDYQVAITDAEDKPIDPARATVSFTYLPFGKDLAGALSGATHGDLRHAEAEKLYASLDCKACHTLDAKSIGPSLKDIAGRYRGKAGAVDVLAGKVISGGSGNWGTYAMSAHPDLSVQDSKSLVSYILSLGTQPASLPLKGTLPLTDHVGKGTEGAYVLVANYLDKGANGIEPLPVRSHLVLRNPKVELEDYEDGNVWVVIGTEQTGFITYIRRIYSGRFVSFKQIDLTHLKSITFRLLEEGAGGTIEIHLDKADGPVVGTLTGARRKSSRSHQGLERRRGYPETHHRPTRPVLCIQESGGKQRGAFLPGLDAL